jgi:hypothetical protein
MLHAPENARHPPLPLPFRVPRPCVLCKGGSVDLRLRRALHIPAKICPIFDFFVAKYPRDAREARG